MIIRPMQVNELDSVLNLFNYYADDAGITEDTFDGDRLRNTVREYCIRPNLFFRVAYTGLRPVGLIGAFISEDPVESQITVTIQFLFLLEEYATVTNYGLLTDHLTDWARLIKAQQIRAIDIGHKQDRLRDIYQQLDFEPQRVTIMNKEVA